MSTSSSFVDSRAAAEVVQRLPYRQSPPHSNIVPLASVARITVGCAPWSTSSANSLSNAEHRAFVYAPICVPDATLQQLTAP